ncbi:MAG: YabP/YqfC family sporulation protein [Oscillospiraceae bacterium]|nr:YabP/YqfC family sporulation protein [Oscillospiraceae bacterium]
MVCRDDRPRSSVVTARAGVFSVGAATCRPWLSRIAGVFPVGCIPCCLSMYMYKGLVIYLSIQDTQILVRKPHSPLGRSAAAAAGWSAPGAAAAAGWSFGGIDLKRTKKYAVQIGVKASKALDVPEGLFTGESEMNIVGNRRVVVEGFKSILRYEEGIISVAVKGMAISYMGRNLSLKTLNRDNIVIEGGIEQINFGEA